MGVLSGEDIKKRIEDGTLLIEPFDSKYIGAASVDLTLGNEFRSFSSHHIGSVEISDETSAREYQKHTQLHVLKDGEPFYLGPNQFCLGITAERVKLPGSLCALVEGRSRFARLGLSVHITASFINPGVDNRTVLEIFNASQLTVALYPGTKICQMIFMTMESPATYNGNFNQQSL